MSKDDRLRTSVRLKIEKGIVLLRSGGVPSVACTLLDMSEGGCRCVAPIGSLDAQTSEAWLKILGPGRALSIEVSCPPYLEHFPLDAEIRTLLPDTEDSIDLGLRFKNVEPQQLQMLSQAILSFATAKVRGAFAPGQQGAAAQYLVGGRTVPESGTRGPGASPIQPAAATSSLPALASAPNADPPSNAAQSNGNTAPPALRRAASRTKTFEAVPVMAPVEAAPAKPAAPSDPPATEPVPDAGPASKTHDPAAISGPAPAVPISQSAPVASGASHDPFRGKKVGEVLVKMGKLTETQVQDAVQRAKGSGERLGRYLLREGLVSPAELCRALALQSGLPMTDLTDAEIPEPLAMLFSHGMMLQYEFVPFDESLRMLCVAAANPIPRAVIEDMERSCGKKIEVFMAQEDLVLQQVDRLQPKEKRRDRKHMRYEANLPIHYQFCNRLGRSSEEATHLGQTIDLSEGGFLIQGPATSLGGPDDLMRRGLCVRFSMTDAQIEVKGLCALRFIKANDRPSREDWKWHYGLQILEMTSDDRRRLKELCIAAGMRQSKHRSTRPMY